MKASHTVHDDERKSKSKKRKLNEDTDDSCEEDIQREKKCNYSAKVLKPAKLPEHVQKCFPNIMNSSNPESIGSVSLPVRAIRLLKGSESSKDNVSQQLDILHDDEKYGELLPYINNVIKVSEVPERLFKINMNKYTGAILAKYRESASICKCLWLSVTALKNHVCKESPVELVLVETLFPAITKSLNQLTNNIKELRGALIPLNFSKTIRNQIKEAPIIPTSLWNFSTDLVKDIKDELKKSSKRYQDRTFFRTANRGGHKPSRFQQAGNRKFFRGNNRRFRDNKKPESNNASNNSKN